MSVRTAFGPRPGTSNDDRFRVVERRALRHAIATAGRITIIALLIGWPLASVAEPAVVPGIPLTVVVESIATVVVLVGIRSHRGRRRIELMLLGWAVVMLISVLLPAFITTFQLRLASVLLPMVPLLFALFMPMPPRIQLVLASLSGLLGIWLAWRIAAVDWLTAEVVVLGVLVGPVLSVPGSLLLRAQRIANFEQLEQIRQLHRLAAARGRALERTNADLARSARTDPMTGLGNRLRLRETLEALAGADVGTTALLLADIDHFKRYNDSRGHIEGDAVLRRLADVLRASVRDGDAVFRYGGEEFLLVLTGPDSDHAVAIAERIRHTLAAAHIDHPDSPVAPQVTVSIGVSFHRSGAGSLSRSVREADAALYRAKQLGRDRVVVADDPALSAVSA